MPKQKKKKPPERITRGVLGSSEYFGGPPNTLPATELPTYGDIGRYYR